MAPTAAAASSARKAAQRSRSKKRDEVAGDSRPKLKRPMPTRARNSIVRQTKALIERRKQLQQLLMRDFERRFRGQPLGDKIPRRELKRMTKVLMRREVQYLRAAGAILEEKESLYRQDPSFERSIDVVLVRTQLGRFERSLGPNLASCQQRANEMMNGSEAESLSDSHGTSTKRTPPSSSNTINKRTSSPNGQIQVETSDRTDISKACVETAKAVEKDPAQFKTAEKVTIEKEIHQSKKDAQKLQDGDMGGAFDDDCRQEPKSKKRKRGDGSDKQLPTQAKKMRKEQTAASKQTTSPKTSADTQSSTSKPAKATKPVSTGGNTAIETMSQSKKPNVDSAVEKQKEYPTLKIHGRTYQVEKLPTKVDVESDEEMPKYKKMAMVMLHPDFNDHVITLAKKKKPVKQRFPPVVSGALMKNPDTDYLDVRCLPTPPTSDEADHENGQPFKQKRVAFQRRGKSSATRQRGTANPRRGIMKKHR